MIWKDRGGEQSEHQSPGFVEEVSSLDRIECRVLLRNRGCGGTSQSEQRFGPWRPRMDWMDGATFLPFSSTIAPRCRVSLQRRDSLYAAFNRDFTVHLFAHHPTCAQLHNMLSQVPEHYSLAGRRPMHGPTIIFRYILRYKTISFLHRCITSLATIPSQEKCVLRT